MCRYCDYQRRLDQIRQYRDEDPNAHPAVVERLFQAAAQQLAADHAAVELRRRFANGGGVSPLNQVGQHERGLRLSKLYRQRG